MTAQKKSQSVSNTFERGVPYVVLDISEKKKKKSQLGDQTLSYSTRNRNPL